MRKLRTNPTAAFKVHFHHCWPAHPLSTHPWTSSAPTVQRHPSFHLCNWSNPNGRVWICGRSRPWIGRPNSRNKPLGWAKKIWNGKMSSMSWFWRKGIIVKVIKSTIYLIKYFNFKVLILLQCYRESLLHAQLLTNDQLEMVSFINL